MKNNTLTTDELNKIPKEIIISMYIQQGTSLQLLQEQNQTILSQNERLIKEVEKLRENVAVLAQNRFGRKTEQSSQIPGQYSMDLDSGLILNEAEAILETEGMEEEPAFEKVVVRKKRKGKRAADLKDIEVVIDEHLLSDDELSEIFPDGYRRLPDEIYKDLEYIPAKFLVHEHHIGVYVSRDSKTVVKADRPERLLKNSILTPALAAGIFNAKYVNAIPLNRLSEEFTRNDVVISRQVMAGWMIRLAEDYFSFIYEEMHRNLLTSKLIHCDETPFKLINDGRAPNSKNYMWVYHSAPDYGTPPIFMYEYQPTRKAENPRNFLKGYQGILVTDGYQVYHTLAAENPENLRVAGCWAHAKRRYAELLKSIGAKSRNGLIAEEGNRRIAAIYHTDHMCKNASARERLDHRNQNVKPLVDAYFAWVKSLLDSGTIDKGSKTYQALNYSQNQEPYLREFLNDPIIPMDNNDAERSIKKFCVGKHNWHVIDSKNGAKASAILYSVAETAKANDLKPYEYFKYVLEQMLLHMEDSPKEFIQDLVPWSDKVPDNCRKLKK